MEPQVNIFDKDLDFEKTAIQIFQFQARENVVYKKYLDTVQSNASQITEVNKIPFLPVQFFKTQKITTGNQATLPKTLFTSSGTTGAETSTHFVQYLKIYEQSFLNCFELFYGDIKEYCLLALLPSYLEREGSSLIYMTEQLIEESKNTRSGFYLNEFEKLLETILHLQKINQKFILLGVTYALLDFAEYYKKHTNKLFSGIVMETGGMKGKRKEMVREEVHKILCNNFNVNEVHSEYGMTELLSQAYSKAEGIFKCPPWMQIFIRDINDPMTILENEKSGGINIIDLANIYSCSFIATQDLGKKYADNSFEVLGRFDNSDLRGCNLLVE